MVWYRIVSYRFYQKTERYIAFIEPFLSTLDKSITTIRSKRERLFIDIRRSLLIWTILEPIYVTEGRLRNRGS